MTVFICVFSMLSTWNAAHSVNHAIERDKTRKIIEKLLILLRL